jgi:pimeloyl-ACP methyl ester carboxylesterase
VLTRRRALAGVLAASVPGMVSAEQGAPRPARSLTLPEVPALDLGRATRHGSVQLGAVRLFFAQFGEGEPVLLLHGGFGHSGHWSRQVEALSGRYHVTVVDTRGHGRSPVHTKLFGFPAFAADAVALLDHLGLDKVAVAGWSDGAITALQLAMLRPERVARIFAFGANTTLDGLVPGGSRTPLFAQYVARCRRDYRALSPHPERWPDLAAGLGAMWRREPNWAWRRLAAIRVPVTVAVAEFDEIIRPDHARRIAAAIPGSRLVALTGLSHFAPMQDPDSFNAALLTSLAAT